MDNNKQFEQIQEYSGQPSNVDLPYERTWFQRFLEFTLPYLKKKHQQADELVEIKLRQEEAQAKILEQQAEQERIRTAEMAHELEQKKLKDMGYSDFELLSEERPKMAPIAELEAKREEYSEKLRLLELKYGARMRFYHSNPSLEASGSVVDGKETISGTLGIESGAKASASFDGKVVKKESGESEDEAPPQGPS